MTQTAEKEDRLDFLTGLFLSKLFYYLRVQMQKGNEWYTEVTEHTLSLADIEFLQSTAITYADAIEASINPEDKGEDANARIQPSKAKPRKRTRKASSRKSSVPSV